MKKIYFIHQDQYMDKRQSDGVQFCIVPEFFNDSIYFYCNEHETFWSSIEDVGVSDKAIVINKKIRPATLLEICLHDLCSYVDTIKELEIENGKLANVTYIHIKL